MWHRVWGGHFVLKGKPGRGEMRKGGKIEMRRDGIEERKGEVEARQGREGWRRGIERFLCPAVMEGSWGGREVWGRDKGN